MLRLRIRLPGSGPPEAGSRKCLRRHKPAWARSCLLTGAFADNNIITVKLGLILWTMNFYELFYL